MQEGMLNKKGQTENIISTCNQQLTMNLKMIVSVDINNKPTDHTQLEKQIENVENTIEETPQVISADNGYHTKWKHKQHTKQRYRPINPNKKTKQTT